MRLQKDRRKAFAVYFSFILVIMLVVLPLFVNALSALEERTMQSSRETLRFGLEQLEAELNRIYQMCQLLGDDQNLHTLHSLSRDVLSPDPDKVVAVRDLKKSYDRLLRMLTLTDDVGIILSNRVILADSRIHMPAEPFWGTYLYAEGTPTFDDWLCFLNSYEQYGYTFNTLRLKHYGKMSAQYVVFSFPITFTHNKGTCCYALFNEDTLLHLLIQSDLLENSRFSLSYGNRMLVNYSKEAISGSTVRIEATSSSYRLTASLDIDRLFFSRQLKGFYQVGVVFLFAYFSLGIAMALLYSRRSVEPLTRTVKAIREVTQSPSLQEDYKDAYAYINHFIAEADKRLKENKLTLANQEMLIRENLMERILRGQLFHASPSEMFSKHFPNFPFPCVMRIVQFVDCSTLNPQQFASLQISARQAVREKLTSVSVIHFSADLLILLTDASEYMPKVDQALCEQLESMTNFSIRMCISQPFPSADDISLTFVHLRHLLRIADVSQTLIYEDGQTTSQPYQNLQYSTRFFEALMRSQLELALKMLNEEYNAFQSNHHITEIDVQQFFYCYRHILCQVINASDLMEKIVPPHYDPNASLSDLLCSIRTCAANICAAQMNRYCLQMDQREKDILYAINSNLGNPDLNIEVILEMFGISNRALQSLMRQATGTTFMDYVNTQRMERARQLLCNTNMPIQEVYTACGYSSANTFYKAFQRSYSVTPKAMRTDTSANEQNR